MPWSKTIMYNYLLRLIYVFVAVEVMLIIFVELLPFFQIYESVHKPKNVLT